MRSPRALGELRGGKGARRRSRRGLEPGRISPVMGNAATVAMLVAFLWSFTMILWVVHLAPHRWEASDLLRYKEMFNLWMLAAFLGLIFLVVDLIGRLLAPARPSRRLILVDVSAAVVLALLFIGNVQLSNFFGLSYWNRVDDYAARYEIRGEFSFPPTVVPGSSANQHWQDFHEWLPGSIWRRPRVELQLQPDQPVLHLSQCTPDIWQLGHEEILLRSGTGGMHRLRAPGSFSWRWGVVQPPEDGSMDGLEMVEELLIPGTSDQLARGFELPGDAQVDALTPETLEDWISENRYTNPFPLLVPREASIEWLDALLRRFEERGVRYFRLLFYG